VGGINFIDGLFDVYFADPSFYGNDPSGNRVTNGQEWVQATQEREGEDQYKRKNQQLGTPTQAAARGRFQAFFILLSQKNAPSRGFQPIRITHFIIEGARSLLK